MANINIYGELHNDTPEGYVTPSQQIMDTELGKRQDQINRELVDEVRDMGLETAYLTCSTPGNTWKKTISAPDFALSTNVRLLIKMEHAHTSPNSPTLNINETGEYTIQYGGRGASSINSWTDNEVLDVYFDGTQYIARGVENRTGYLVCNTLADTAAKTVDCPAFNLNTYVRVLVKMTYTNTASNPTLNINGTGAKSIVYNGSAASSSNSWSGGEVLDVYYSGTSYIATTYGVAQFSTGEKVGDVGIDDEPAAGSDNLVKSGGVYDWFNFGWLWCGNAIPSTVPKTNPNNQKIYYVVSTEGTYTNFVGEGGTPLTLNEGEVAVFFYSGSIWVKSLLGRFAGYYSIIGTILQNASHTWQGIQNYTLNGINKGDVVTLRFDYSGNTEQELYISYSISGGVKRILEIKPNRYYTFIVPDDLSGNTLYLTHPISGELTANLYVARNPLLESIKAIISEISDINKEIDNLSTSISLLEAYHKGWNSVPTNADSQKLYVAIEDIAFYNEQDNGSSIYSFRIFGYFTDHVQITIWDGENTYSFLYYTNDITGVKTYNCVALNKPYAHCKFTVDWSKYDNTQWGSIDEDLQILSKKYVDYAIQYTDDKFAEILPTGINVLNADITNFAQVIPNAGAVSINKSITMDSFIDTIQAKVGSTGTYKFSIGFVDQRKMLVSRKSFTLQLLQGYNKVSLLEPIYTGEMLFLHCSSSSGANSVNYNSSYTNGKLFYGQGTDNVINFVELTNSAPAFDYSVIDKKDLLFAPESEVEELSNKINDVQASIPTIPLNTIIASPNGTKWKLIVSDAGVVSAKSPYYRSFVSVGNSLTNAELSAYWNGDWGMAASIKDNDYLHIVAAKNNEYVSTEYIASTSSTPWETATDSATRRAFLVSTVKPLFDNATVPVDCVILKVSDNITTDAMRTTLLQDYKELIDYVRGLAPNADVYGMSCYYVRPQTDAIIQQACREKGVPFIWDLKSSLIESDTFEGAWVSGSDNTLHVIDYEAVAGHPSDYGHYQIANLILDAMGLEHSNKSHKVTINTSLVFEGRSYWVEGGIYSFKCDNATTVIVVDAENNSISITQQSNGVWTFIMPNSDVIITATN